MQLLLIRHAIAEEREDFTKTGKDDRLRPLTDGGRKKMKQAARGLKGLVPRIDLLATSPLTRAAQTGAIVDSVYGGLQEVEIPRSSPPRPRRRAFCSGCASRRRTWWPPWGTSRASA